MTEGVVMLSWVAGANALVMTTLILAGCHRYDFLVCVYGTDLLFSNFLNFILHLGLITTPHVLYVHMTYVYFLFSCFILHTITWPREVIIVL